MPHGTLAAGLATGKVGHPARQTRAAAVRQRTGPAVGIPLAEHGAEVHQRLSICRHKLRRRQQGGGERPDLLHEAGLCGVALDHEHAREHALCVPVRHDGPLAEGESGHGARRRGAESRKFFKLGRGFRASPAHFVDDDPDRLEQVAGARVVSEARPERHDVVVGRSRQTLGRRKGGHEGLVLGKHRHDLRLLQHHLRDKSRIPVLDLPRQVVPAAGFVPADDCICK